MWGELDTSDLIGKDEDEKKRIVLRVILESAISVAYSKKKSEAVLIEAGNIKYAINDHHQAV